jgi:hypothetical protein
MAPELLSLTHEFSAATRVMSQALPFCQSGSDSIVTIMPAPQRLESEYQQLAVGNPVGTIIALSFSGTLPVFTEGVTGRH